MAAGVAPMVAGSLLHPSCSVRCEERHTYRRLPILSAKMRFCVHSCASMSCSVLVHGMTYDEQCLHVCSVLARS